MCLGSGSAYFLLFLLFSKPALSAPHPFLAAMRSMSLKRKRWTGVNFALMLNRVPPLDISCSSPFFSRYLVWEMMGMAWKRMETFYLYFFKKIRETSSKKLHNFYFFTLSLSNSKVVERWISSSICLIFPTCVLHSSKICMEAKKKQP